MRIGRSYRRDGVDGTFDALVIGSGIGGLTAASLLARRGGLRVLVLERHFTAGGFTHAFERPGYDWDVGVHYIGQVHEGGWLRRAFDAIGDGSLEWADMGPVYDTIVIGDHRYPFHAGVEAWRAGLLESFPAQEAALEAYLGLLRLAGRSVGGFFARRTLPGPLRVVPGWFLGRRGARLAKRTTAEVLAELTDDVRLRTVLAGQWGDYGLPPDRSSFLMHAMVAAHYLEGAGYPVGGAASIAGSIVPVIEGAGGRVVISAEVERILVSGRRAVGVRLADGVEVRAPLVISDAGAANTFLRLLPETAPGRRSIAEGVRRIGPSMAHASLYLGFRGSPGEHGMPRGNLWIYAGDDHQGNLDRWMRNPDAPLPLVYVSFPSAKDPDFERRHPGRSTVEVVIPVPWTWFERWEGTRWHRRGEEYEALKERLTRRMLEPLWRELPHLRNHLDHCELSTPLTTAHFAGYRHGEIYGLAHTPERFAQDWLRPATPVRGLYLTGADVSTAGVAGALVGGALTASVILRRNLLSELRAPPPAGPGAGRYRSAAAASLPAA